MLKDPWRVSRQSDETCRAQPLARLHLHSRNFIWRFGFIDYLIEFRVDVASRAYYSAVGSS
eukprot:2918956-Pleurochrysis_carterae.AAC.2